MLVFFASIIESAAEVAVCSPTINSPNELQSLMANNAALHTKPIDDICNALGLKDKDKVQLRASASITLVHSGNC